MASKTHITLNDKTVFYKADDGTDLHFYVIYTVPFCETKLSKLESSVNGNNHSWPINADCPTCILRATILGIG
jgi:hypothetical protein